MKLVRVGERETWCHWKRELEDEEDNGSFFFFSK